MAGAEMLLEYIIQRIQEELGVASYEDNDSMFTGMEITKKKSETSHGVSMSADGFEDKIKSIGISHGRTRTPRKPLTEPLTEANCQFFGRNWKT